MIDRGWALLPPALRLLAHDWYEPHRRCFRLLARLGEGLASAIAAVRVCAEECDRALQVLRLLGKLLGHARHFLRRRRVLLNNRVELLQSLSNLIRAHVLLATGARDFLHQARSFLDARQNLR